MNPEFERNLYLEFSFARLIGMPLFLMVIFVLTYSINDQKFDENSARVAIWLYIFIVLFWGARQASESIFDELRNHTWDTQKTSAISPWSLTWGKLFGSTIFNWYGGVLCLLIYILTKEKSDYVTMIVLYALSGGLLAQSLGLLASLFALRKKQQFNSSIGYLVVLFLIFCSTSMLFGVGSKRNEIIHWYDFEITLQLFGLISLVVACGWTIVGIYRLLAQELQIRTLPWVWLCFVSFLILYTQGLVVGVDHYSSTSAQDKFSNYQAMMLIVFGICSGLTYCLILIDENSPMLMRRLWVYALEEKWERFCQELPCWSISLGLVLPASLYLSFVFPTEAVEKLHFYPIPAFLLMLRDVGIVLFFYYAPNPKRALGLSILFLTLLYWIIPAIFIASGAKIVAALFLPLFSDSMGLAIIFAGSQVGLVSYLLFNRWQNTIHQFQNPV
jgi:hypothetical protein